MPTSSTKSTTLSDKLSDQGSIDTFDLRRWKRVSALRPGDTCLVQGTLPCGKPGRVEFGVVINACVTATGVGDQALIATSTYGRRWFGGAESPYRVISKVATTT